MRQVAFDTGLKAEKEKRQCSNTVTSARLPAQNLERAKVFYADKLGLGPTGERPGGLRYQSGTGSFSLFESSGSPSGDHTQLAVAAVPVPI